MIATEKTIGPADGQAGRQHDVAHVAAHRLAAELLPEPVHDVLGHHDRRVDQHADRDGDPRQRHGVGLDVDDAQTAAGPP